MSAFHAARKLETLAIDMRCNLRRPDVARVIPGFNYEAHNAAVYKSTLLQSPLYSVSQIPLRHKYLCAFTSIFSHILSAHAQMLLCLSFQSNF